MPAVIPEPLCVFIPSAQSHSPLCASFQGPESPVKLPVKIRIKIQTHSKV